MKKLFLIALFLILIPITLFAQVNCPILMQRDSVAGDTTVSIWFNSSNSLTNPILYPEKVDIIIYAALTDGSNGDDTLIVDTFGLNRRKRTGNINDLGVGQTETIASDSTRLFQAILTSGESYWWRIPITKFNSNFGLYEGMRMIYSNTGADTDTIVVQTQYRVVE